MTRPNGWTGGAFSVLRVLSATSLGVWGLLNPGGDTWSALGAATPWVTLALALWLAVGYFTRTAAVLCAAFFVAESALSSFEQPFVELAFVLLACAQALAPPAPYGSFDARERWDPGGGWRLPPAVLRGTRVGALALVLLFPPTVGPELALLVLLALAAFDPAWVRPAGSEPSVAFYDGGCGVCHTLVRFLLAEDRRATMRFAPLQGPTFQALVKREAWEHVPDAMIAELPDGTVRVGASAVFQLLSELGGFWRLLAATLRVVPSGLSDLVYTGFARIRKRLMRAPKDVCPVLEPSLGRRFLA